MFNLPDEDGPSRVGKLRQQPLVGGFACCQDDAVMTPAFTGQRDRDLAIVLWVDFLGDEPAFDQGRNCAAKLRLLQSHAVGDLVERLRPSPANVGD